MCQSTAVAWIPHRTKSFFDYSEARRSVKRKIEQKNKWFFMQINFLCISYVLLVDIFTRSFDDFIPMKFLIALFLRATRSFQAPRLLTLEVFANLPVYCTLPVYYFDRNLGIFPFIPPSPSIWNSRVSNQPFLTVIDWCILAIQRTTTHEEHICDNFFDL